jgi:hypothetical protein
LVFVGQAVAAVPVVQLAHVVGQRPVAAFGQGLGMCGQAFHSGAAVARPQRVGGQLGIQRTHQIGLQHAFALLQGHQPAQALVALLLGQRLQLVQLGSQFVYPLQLKTVGARARTLALGAGASLFNWQVNVSNVT